jgi:hypothetical protein
MAHGTHDHAADPRNDEILVWVNGELLPRDRAVVSVFEPRRPRDVRLSPHDAAVAEACRPAYDRLRDLRLRL